MDKGTEYFFWVFVKIIVIGFLIGISLLSDSKKKK